MTPQKSKPTNQACAACRYQRRKCTPDCLFRPYFPPNHQQQFQNVHKLFGVSNITKIIKNLDDDDRHKDNAMKSLIYQADARAQYPVEGCCKIIRQLHHHYETASAELQFVLRELALCRTFGVQKYNKQFDNITSSFFDNNASFDCDLVDFDEVGCDDVLVQNDVTKYESSEENVYDEENEKDVMKVENAYYNEEEEEEYDDDDDDVNLDTFQDGKAI
uniref:LOB domain-containing protein 22-like n=1 Tax=Erigeron canadensis TaxID=72917 RepID=UPI001CB99198|nr:LOB domain-containing protein 22-like [Erigeron canadensis]